MAPVNEPKNTAEAANATVPMPEAPAVTPQSGGVGEGGSKWRDVYEKPDQRPKEYREGDPTPDSPPVSQGTHEAPGGHGSGPTMTTGKKR